MTLLEETLSTEALSKMSHDSLVHHFLQYKERYESLNEEYDEYKASSMEMEQMLEKELLDAKRAREAAESERDALRRDAERMRARHETERREALAMDETLRREIATLRHENEEARKRIRMLEQANDDLERSERYKAQLAEDTSRELERLMERTALLENELAETQFHAESAARTREELRPSRPRIAVGPLRVERQPEREETPEQERKALAGLALEDSMEVDDAGPSHALPLTPDSSQGNTPAPCERTLEESKEAAPRRGGAFMHSLNKIVKDLLVRVDRVESVLTTMNQGGPRA